MNAASHGAPQPHEDSCPNAEEGAPDPGQVARQLIAEQTKIIDQVVEAARAAAARARQDAQADVARNLEKIERMRDQLLCSTTAATAVHTSIAVPGHDQPTGGNPDG